MTDVIKEKVEQVTEVLTKSMGAGKWIKDFVKSKNPKFAGKSKEKRKEMALGAFYSKEETESVDEGMFSPPKMITGKAAKNRKDYLRDYHPRLIAAKKAAGSSKDYDYEPQRDSETGGTKPSTHKNVYNSNKFKPATKMSFEAGLKRAAERAKSKTNEEVSFDESNDWKQGFLDDYNVLRGHKNPEVKKHLTAAEINFKNKNWQNAHSYMQKAKNAARTSKQANEEVSLDEGRGRPPKPGSAAYKRRQEDGGGEGDRKGLEAHLIDTQSHRTDHPPFHFADGEKVQLSRDHSNKAREHINAMKGPGKNPQARDNAIKAMSKSHAGFKQAIGVESKPEETKSSMSAQRDKPKLSLTKEESKMAQEDILEKLQAALDAGILSQNDFDKLTQIDEISYKVLNRAGNKAIETGQRNRAVKFRQGAQKQYSKELEANRHPEARDVHDLGDRGLPKETLSRKPTHEFKPTSSDHGNNAKVRVWHNAGKNENETHMQIQGSAMGDSNGAYSYKHPTHSLSAIKHDVNNEGSVKEEVEAVDEKALSPKQKKIAAVAGDPGKIDAEDFKKLRKEETTAGVAAVVAALSRNLKELK